VDGERTAWSASSGGEGSALQLYRQRRIEREEIGGQYVYLSRDPGMGRNQRRRRQERPGVWQLGGSPVGEDRSSELKAAMILFYSLLDEQQRRLYTGLEAQKLGYVEIARSPSSFGLDMHTVARGRRELFGEQVHRDRVRKEGGGRKPAEKKRRK